MKRDEPSNEELRSAQLELAPRNTEATGPSDDLTNVLSSVEIPILLLGRDSRIRRFAPAAARVLQLSPSDIGRPLGEIARTLALASAEMAAQVLVQLSPVERTLRDESGRWYQLTARPYLTLDGNIDGTVIVAFDVDTIQRATEHVAAAQRERAQLALARSEGEFREVLLTAAEGILMIDAAGRVVFCNPAATELFGYATDELLGVVIDQLVPKRFWALYVARRDEYLRAPAAQRLGREHALLGRRKDGTEVPVEVTLSPKTRDGGRVIVCFVTDVSARRDSERRIADYQEKLRQMAFDAAIGEERERRRIAADLHDRIGQSLALAQMKLKSVQKAGNRLSAVDETIALLAQSITDTRTLIFELSPPILYELGLKEALSWLAEDLGKRSGLRIELSDDAFAQPLHDATAAILYRAVQELLTNVIKHARARSAKVSLRRSNDQVEIDVEDTGIGFDPQAVTQSSAPGGFGLFSVREQINRLGGAMEVTSGERRGTRVSLRLPLDPELGTVGSRSTSAGEPPAQPRPAT